MSKIKDLNLSKEKKALLEKILSKTGDLNFKRRVVTLLDYLDIRDGDVVLDAGCGEGFYSMIFLELYGCKVYAIDYDKKILDQAKERLDKYSNVFLSRGDICNLKFENEFFDKIVCTEVLEHLNNDASAVKELKRVLRKGGIVAATVPNENYPMFWDPLNWFRERLGLGHFNPLNGFFGGIWAYDHKRLYSPEQFRNLFSSNGLKVQKIEVLTHYGLPLNHLILYVGKQAYTKLPVSEEVKTSMEKFDWGQEKPEKFSISKAVIDFGFNVMKLVDKLNEKEFPISKSTMAVSLRAVKK